jgi:hypothetical protein
MGENSPFIGDYNWCSSGHNFPQAVPHLLMVNMNLQIAWKNGVGQVLFFSVIFILNTGKI